jgi:4-hydroxy-tetrahydrodipicolinate synthase
VNWGGTIAGAVIPLWDDESIDWASFEAHLESFVGCGLSGVVINADTGEGGLLAPGEREDVLRFAVGHIGARLPVATGLLPAHTGAVTESARSAGDLGAAALQVFAPPVFMGAPLPWQPVVAYYEAIAAATDVPLIAYSAPAGLGVTFELEVLRRLADVPGVQAIKESSWSRSRFAEAAAAFAGERHPVALLSGQDSFILDSLLVGADGAMLAAAAADPAAYATMWTLRGTAGAAEIQSALDPYIERLFAPPLRDFRARLKAVLARDGMIATAAVRSPLQRIGEDEAAGLAEVLAAGRRRVAALGSII